MPLCELPGCDAPILLASRFIPGFWPDQAPVLSMLSGLCRNWAFGAFVLAQGPDLPRPAPGPDQSGISSLGRQSSTVRRASRAAPIRRQLSGRPGRAVSADNASRSNASR